MYGHQIPYLYTPVTYELVQKNTIYITEVPLLIFIIMYGAFSGYMDLSLITKTSRFSQLEVPTYDQSAKKMV